ncbi:MAG TPA: hypothetical protein VGL81_34950 [Polyangiaceae bacterium]|jgi:hypothetical protein
MARSMLTAAFAALALVACAQTSQPAPVTTAPLASATPDPPPSPSPTASSTSTPSSTSTSSSTSDDAGVGAQFRACQSDADCVAVPRAGCCNNGWKEAVAVSQKDAYAQANACTRKRPICPMFRVRDARVAYCEASTHLCSLKQP